MTWQSQWLCSALHRSDAPAQMQQQAKTHQTPNQITVARKIRSNQSWLWNYFTKDLLMLLLHHTKERRP